jgi:hypothetical protein
MDGFIIEKWDRFFALYENGELLCVTVYKKGALAVQKRIEELKSLVRVEEHDAAGLISKNPQ